MATPSTSTPDSRTPGPKKTERAKIAKYTINYLVPHILATNARAKAGSKATEKIYYSPAHRLSFPPWQPLPSTSPFSISHSSASSSIPSSSSSSTAPPSSVIPKISVIQSDTYDAAHAIHKTLPKNGKAKIGVLNMASFLRPGGGVLQGAMAQEESLCVRSTLYSSLNERFYRLPRLGGLWSPDVLVFRDSAGKDMKKEDWYFVDVISIAAIKGPDVTADKDGKIFYDHESDKEEMILKIRLIHQIAQKKQITHLVLGALGCGAYHNPPLEVAKMFQKVICGDRKSAGVRGVQEIVFAIFDDGENLRVFKEVFEGKRIGVGQRNGKKEVVEEDVEMTLEDDADDVEVITREHESTQQEEN